MGYVLPGSLGNYRRNRWSVLPYVAENSRPRSRRGNGLKEICKELNGWGITNKGRGWQKNVVHYLLTNEAYTGTAVWGVKSKDEKAGEPVRVENAWPALVSRELFEAVQQGLHERAPTLQWPARVGSQYLLSGLLRCGVCGKPYSGQGAKSGQFAYYARSAIAQHFGPTAPTYERDIAALKSLFDQHADSSTIRVKRQLWENLLTAALGEIARSSAQLDDLFVRHTYLSAVIGMVVQASFGGDIKRLAENDPADLLLGRDFRSKTGLQGVVESDLFAWPIEVGGLPLLRTLARRIARFKWQEAPNDVASILYETVIPSNERRQLGEYYTPDWLARAIVREVVTDPLEQYVLDPACGSGTFVAEAVTHFIETAKATSLDSKDVLEWLRFSVAGH